MRYWSYSEPDIDVSVTLSENAILTSYFPKWYELMAKAGKDIPADAKITERMCIDDWITIHWAYETDEFGTKI
jgi:hypothetical protein